MIASDLKPGDVIDAVPLLGPDPECKSATAVIRAVKVHDHPGWEGSLGLRATFLAVDGELFDPWGLRYSRQWIICPRLACDMVIERIEGRVAA